MTMLIYAVALALVLVPPFLIARRFVRTSGIKTAAVQYVLASLIFAVAAAAIFISLQMMWEFRNGFHR